MTIMFFAASLALGSSLELLLPFIPRVMVFGAGDLGLAKAVRGFVPLLEEEETRALPSEDTASGHLQVWTWLLLDTRPAGPSILALQPPEL